MKHVVSVSLGSSQRNRSLQVTFAGESFRVERLGTDGDVGKAEDLIAELDGKVEAIGLGGVDRYLFAGRRRYELRDAARMARAATKTPVVDGGGIKRVLEPLLLRRLVDSGKLEVAGKRVLVMCAVDRPGMAETFPALGAHVVYGDLLFAVGIPIPLTSLRQVAIVGALFLPLLCRLPMSLLYPTGQKQQTHKPKYQRYFQWADVLAGDFHYIKRYMPTDISGKVVITNTTRRDDVALLRERHCRALIATTPEFEGETFGANVTEGVLLALMGKRPEDAAQQDYLDTLAKLGWEPAVVEF